MNIEAITAYWTISLTSDLVKKQGVNVCKTLLHHWVLSDDLVLLNNFLSWLITKDSELITRHVFLIYV